jgi:hypothetical protein
MKKILVLILAAGLVGCNTVKNEKKQVVKSKLAVTKSVNLIDCENPKKWTGKVLLNKKVKRNGKFSFESFGKYPTKTDFKTFILVDPKKTYTLTCYMRSLDSKKPASGYMGLSMYDKNKKLIAYNQVAVYLGTESELLVPATKGSKEIIIKKTAKCAKARKHWKIAFNAKAKYADLPNSDLSPKGESMKIEGNKIKLTLKSPLKKDYKAGTKVRMHSPWGPPFYWAAKGWMPGEWKKFSVTMKGIATHGVPMDKFWKGTKYVKPFFWFGNWDRIPKPEARLLVDDFTFTESK